ncbi:MAG: hypothetical protein BWY71_01639 [Planctomycetes bacterium ADurb.Bin412]|nr:MAG: hypothetical protein BWY71_01639 [Planctomycetes bacterium ADurb.Bin412]
MTAPGSVRFVRGRSQPHIIIESVGYRFGGHYPGCRPFAQIGVNCMQFTEHPAACDPYGKLKTFDAPPLGAALIHGTVPFHGIGDGPAFGNGQGYRFFAIDVLARPGRGNGNQGVPVIGGGNHYCINVRPRQQFPKIIIGGTILILIGLIDDTFGRQQMIAVHIAHRQNPYIFTGQEVAQIEHTLPADADYAHGEPLAGCRGTGFAQGRRGNEIRSTHGCDCRRCGLSQKCSPGNLFHK